MEIESSLRNIIVTILINKSYDNKIRKKKNKDGSVEEERYNPLTGERIIVKKRIDEQGYIISLI